MGDESGLFNETKMSRSNGQSAHVKLSDWLKADCLFFLTFIPVIGTIAFAVLSCYLAFNDKTNKSLKTRLQANLIWTCIFVVLVFMVFAFGGTTTVSGGNQVVV
jgi:hypothetical protein